MPSAQSVPLARVVSESRARASDARAGWPLRTAASTSSVQRPAQVADVVVLAHQLGGGQGLVVLAEAVVQQGDGVLAGHSPALAAAGHAGQGGLHELDGLSLTAPERGGAQAAVGPELAPGGLGDRLRLRDERRALLQFARVCVQEVAGQDRERELAELPPPHARA